MARIQRGRAGHASSRHPSRPINSGGKIAVGHARTIAMLQDGLITLPSRTPARDTVERLLAALAKRNMTVFARIDHAAGAASAGLELRPTEVVMFGNPKGGTALMQDRQAAGIHLPLKALVWQDADGKVWLSYNDPAWSARRHGLGAASAGAVEAMGKALGAIAAEVTT